MPQALIKMKPGISPYMPPPGKAPKWVPPRPEAPRIIRPAERFRLEAGRPTVTKTGANTWEIRIPVRLVMVPGRIIVPRPATRPRYPPYMPPPRGKTVP